MDHGLRTGISQRDMNHYEFLTEESTKDKILESVSNFWEAEIKDKWDAQDCKPPPSSYIRLLRN